MVFLGFFVGFSLFGLMILTGLDIISIPSYIYFILFILSVTTCNYLALSLV